MQQFNIHNWFRKQYINESPVELSLKEKIYARLDSILMDLENIPQNELTFDSDAVMEGVKHIIDVLQASNVNKNI